MTLDDHRERHQELHRRLDELIADYLTQVKGAMLTTSSLMDLVKWSNRQTIAPTIRCETCGRVSYNPNDIEQKYCGACHKFADDPPRKDAQLN
jgi:hypothetical protein